MTFPILLYSQNIKTGVCFAVFSIQENDRNPFHAEGELSKKAELIILNSMISRTNFRISDPDSGDSARPQETEVKTAAVDGSGDHIPPSGNTEESHKTPEIPKEELAALQTAEVLMVTSRKPETQKAEQVKLKTKANCCVLQ